LIFGRVETGYESAFIALSLFMRTAFRKNHNPQIEQVPYFQINLALKCFCRQAI